MLGVSVERDGEEITPQAARAAFRKCAVRYHPDKLQQNNITGKEAEAAKEKFGNVGRRRICSRMLLARDSSTTIMR